MAMPITIVGTNFSEALTNPSSPRRDPIPPPPPPAAGSRRRRLRRLADSAAPPTGRRSPALPLEPAAPPPTLEGCLPTKRRAHAAAQTRCGMPCRGAPCCAGRVRRAVWRRTPRCWRTCATSCATSTADSARSRRPAGSKIVLVRHSTHSPVLAIQLRWCPSLPKQLLLAQLRSYAPALLRQFCCCEVPHRSPILPDMSAR